MKVPIGIVVCRAGASSNLTRSAGTARASTLRSSGGDRADVTESHHVGRGVAYGVESRALFAPSRRCDTLRAYRAIRFGASMASTSVNRRACADRVVHGFADRRYGHRDRRAMFWSQRHPRSRVVDGRAAVRRGASRSAAIVDMTGSEILPGMPADATSRRALAPLVSAAAV